MKKVVIIHRIIAPYRVAFYERLKASLEEEGIDLTVVYGQHAKNEKEPYTDLDIGIKTRARYIYFGKRFVVWLPALKHACGSDLVIVQHSNKNLINHLLIPLSKLLGFKLAFWGNCKREFAYYKEKAIKKNLWWKLAAKVDHWFAYNDVTKKIVCSTDYPEDKITSVQNSIDTKAERQIYESISKTELAELRVTYGIGDRSSVGIFCSRLYRDKRLSFLIDAVGKIRERIPDFHFFVIGDGVDSQIVKEFAVRNDDWFHWVGTQYGRDKVKYFKLAQFQLIPGLVGLNIVDSFAFETPMITTQNKLHSVEISYIANGVNGIMTRNSLDEYIDAVVKVAIDSELQERLFAGCREAAEHYTIENMAQRFTDGICKALAI